MKCSRTLSIAPLLAVALLLGLSQGCGGGDSGTQNTEDACTPGERRCAGTGLEQCLPDGSGWEAGEECQAGSSCSGGSCICDNGLVPLQGGGCESVSTLECLPGFSQVDGEPGCLPETPSCSAGSLAVVTGCIAPGVAECAQGTLLDPLSASCTRPDAPCQEDAPNGWLLCEPKLPQCGTDKWPAKPAEATGAVLYVDASFQGTSTGERNSPYKSIGQAVEAAASGDWVLVATGEYDEGVLINKGLHILGACPETTKITGELEATVDETLLPVPAVVWVNSGDAVSLSGVSLQGDPPSDEADPNLTDSPAGLVVTGGASLALSDVVAKDLAGACVVLAGAGEATLEGLHCLELLAGEEGILAGHAVGVYSTETTNLTISKSRFVKVQGYDVYAAGVAVEVDSCWFEGRGRWNGNNPMGVRVAGAPLSVKASRFKDKMQHAVLAEECDVEFVGNLVDGLVSDYQDINGPAVKLIKCDVMVQGNHLMNNQVGGVHLEASTGEISQNIVEGSLPSDPGQKGGDGITLIGCDRQSVLVEGNTLVANTRSGLTISGSKAEVVGNFVGMTAVSPLAGVSTGAGINVVSKSTVSVSSNALSDNPIASIRFNGSFGSITGNLIQGALEGPAGGSAGECAWLAAGILMNESFMDKVESNLVARGEGVGIRSKGGKVTKLSYNLVREMGRAPHNAGVGMWLEATIAAVEGNVAEGCADAGMVLRSTSGAITGNVVKGGEAGGAGMVVESVVNPAAEVAGNYALGCTGRGMTLVDVKGRAANNVVRDTRAGPNGLGAGLWAEGAGALILARNRILNSVGAGVVMVKAPSLTASGLYVAGVEEGTLTLSGSNHPVGDGVLVLSGAVAAMLNSVVVDSAQAGIYVGPGAEAALSNVELIGNVSAGIEADGTINCTNCRFSSPVQSEQILEGVSRMIVMEPLGPAPLCMQ